ncbi:MAG: PqqD family protein [Prevotella sp.]|nr:PqqD family protein [Prevotella sp.]
MKQKKGFKLRNICGEHVVVAEGIENIDFSKIISMNESSAYLWEKVVDSDFTAEDLCKYLLEEYDVDEKTALADAKAVIKQWTEAGIIED